MAGDILVVVEHEGGTAKRTSLEALTAARALGGSITAFVAGEGASDAAAACGAHGAETVLTSDVDIASRPAWAEAIANAAKARSSKAVLLSNTAVGKDLGPRIGGLLDVGVASDCIELHTDGDSIVARRPVFAGKALVNVTGSGSTMVATLRPNAFGVSEGAAAGNVEAFSTDAPTKGLGAVLRDIVAAAEKKIELTEANVVVSGGRGMKGPENFHLIEELAAAFGGAVGASRAVVDAGWRPHSEQVGQTGKTVSPTLYIAVGISGAIQHLAGMRTSKFIVAINKDAEAPIFKVADYGIVGDAFEVVPAMTKAVQELKAQV